MYQGHYPELGHRGPDAAPPRTVTDREGRAIAIRAFGDGPRGDEVEALVELYLDFDPADRTLGVPPVGESRIRSWLEVVTADHGVLAWHDDRVVGHAVLVIDDRRAGSVELAIFLHPDYQGAGIGTALVTSLLEYGAARDVEHVWLLVDRGNRPAVELYRDVGFAVVEQAGGDVEMALTL